MSPMDEKTLKALHGSIAKWQAIVDGDGEDMGHLNCPLCSIFIDRQCIGCPVQKASGASSCDLTPYEKWWDYHLIRSEHDMRELRVYDDEPRSKTLAKAELAFLKSLLPKE